MTEPGSLRRIDWKLGDSVGIIVTKGVREECHMTMEPPILQGNIRVVGVLGVEVADIVAIKWEKEGREITLEEHRLGQKN